jgi:hypothetical protein
MHRLPAKAKIRSVTVQVLHETPENAEFSALELQKKVTSRIFRKTGVVRRPYPDTVLRYLRYAREGGKYDYKCISRGKSLYRKQRSRSTSMER